MSWLSSLQIKSVVFYKYCTIILIHAIKDSRIIAKENKLNMFHIYRDMISCFHKYYLYSEQYKIYRVWSLDEKERQDTIVPVGETNRMHDRWDIINRYNNRRFITKWSSKIWDINPIFMRMRNRAYTKRYNAGKWLIVQHNVDIQMEHYLEGTIEMGNHVLLAKNVFIDYSGHLKIGNHVGFSNGTIIETHTHEGSVLKDSSNEAIQTTLVIDDGVTFGTNAMVLETCSKIGRYARIGAGAIVRNDIPPYALAIGNPAKIVGFFISPDELEEVEKDLPPEKKTSVEEYTKVYNKYFRNRVKENIAYSRL